MNAFIGILTVLISLNVLFRFICLAANDYPFKEAPRQAWQDVVNLVIWIPMCIWGWHLIGEFK